MILALLVAQSSPIVSWQFSAWIVIAAGLSAVLSWTLSSIRTKRMIAAAACSVGLAALFLFLPSIYFECCNAFICCCDWWCWFVVTRLMA